MGCVDGLVSLGLAAERTNGMNDDTRFLEIRWNKACNELYIDSKV